MRGRMLSVYLTVVAIGSRRSVCGLPHLLSVLEMLGSIVHLTGIVELGQSAEYVWFLRDCFATR